ncbi:substrate-binding domain-containing protein [Microbacterium marinilacus]|uniref:substrate-binding domain-containing protein n=1 Tax=Microbacterium marinilacus TaxID=415209 RepID=UPI001C8CF7A4|nr:substrate-binding domain-containing protein [Microbacterium marinilacus]MBY0690465.1 substrate-binding domain-containing protein [Microbacterium marinilacus]
MTRYAQRVARKPIAKRDAAPLPRPEIPALAVSTPAAPGEVASAALRSRPSATAVVAHHDELAARVWQHFRAHGDGREGRVALVGYDDGTVAETIGLTTVRQPFEESGAAAMTLMLEEIMAGAREPRTLILQPELVIRAST